MFVQDLSLVAVRIIVFCHDQPGAAFDPDPEETSRREIELRTSPQGERFAVIGWRHAGLEAASLAAANPFGVDRLVLCSVPAPIDGMLDFDPGDIGAKTLLLYGQNDPAAPARHARWWKDRIRDSRVEMVPNADSDIINTMWARALPRRTRHASLTTALQHVSPEQSGGLPDTDGERRLTVPYPVFAVPIDPSLFVKGQSRAARAR